MDPSQREFLKLLLDAGALKFGQFTLKSGRSSPYFINLGALSTGERLCAAGEAYARTIHDRLGLEFDVVFGPAYKGIPLAVATCEALYRLYGVSVGFTADRKEEKDHGEGGAIVGSALGPETRVAYVDDVISAGTSFRNTMRLVGGTFGSRVVGSVVAVDRQERGTTRLGSSVRELAGEFGVPIHAILKIREVVEELAEKPFEGTVHIDHRLRDEFLAYQHRYGAE
jgi:orotate phosphoribosyltransferase